MCEYSVQSHRTHYPLYANSTNMPRAVFGTVCHDVHRRRRASIDSIFSKRSVNSFEPVLQEMIDRLSKLFVSASRQNRPVELGSAYLALTTDAVCQHALGRPFALLGNEKRTKDWKKTVRAVASLTPFAKQFPWMIPAVFSLQIPLLRRLAPSLNKLVELQHVRCRKVRVSRADV
jgi:cytochrome P450